MKGNAAFGLKASATRRRSKLEIQQAKLDEMEKARMIQEQLQELAQMKEMHGMVKEQQEVISSKASRIVEAE